MSKNIRNLRQHLFFQRKLFSSSSSSTSNNNDKVSSILQDYQTHRLLRNFPVITSKIHRGFGRGKKELGYPTANFPQFYKQLEENNLQDGVYYGLARFMDNPSPSSSSSSNSQQDRIYSVACNIGHSPSFFLGNPTRVIESHLIDFFPFVDLYDRPLRVILLGYLRPEMVFKDLNELKEKISYDVKVTKAILERLEETGRLIDIKEKLLEERKTDKKNEEDEWVLIANPKRELF